jgi:hypothetical protein
LYVIFDLYIPKISTSDIKKMSSVKENTDDDVYKNFLKEFD